MSNQLNCPNCGAPLGLSDRCEYCGTTFIDCTIDTEKPFYIKVRHNGVLFIDKVRLRSFDSEVNQQCIELNDAIRRYTYLAPERIYSIELESLGVNNG